MNASAAPLPASTEPLPRILLLEDDPVSAEFLATALAALPAQVERVADLAAARACLARGLPDRHALWLFDARLPDGSGGSLLTELRAAGHPTPAIAHTAEPRPEERTALLAAGFLDVLIKPIGVQALHAAVRRALGDTAPIEDTADATDAAHAAPGHAAGAADADPPIWDDAVALRALNGNASHVAAMRGLFLQELEATAARVTNAVNSRDAAALAEELHRLRAACGFVGAARLAAAIETLRGSSPASDALAGFEAAARQTLSSAASSSA